MFTKILKIILISTGALTLFLVGAIVLGVNLFSPLVHIDQNGVKFFGGSIVIDNPVPGSAQSIEASSIAVTSTATSSANNSAIINSNFAATVDLVPGRDLNINFDNAKIDLHQSNNSQLSWVCKSNAAKAPSFSDNNLVISFAEVGGKCNINVPVGVAIQVNGNNGSVELNHLNNKQSVVLTNGKVEVDELMEFGYNYNVAITNGSWTNPPAKKMEKNLDVSVKITNGRFEVDRKN